MARRKRRSTRKGQTRKTARKSYMPPVRRRRRFGSRRGRVTFRSRKNGKTGLIKARSMTALKECGWITAGGAAGLLAGKYMPNTYAGMSSETLLGAGAFAYGVMRNNPKAIYIGFGALYPRLQTEMANLIT